MILSATLRPKNTAGLMRRQKEKLNTYFPGHHTKSDSVSANSGILQLSKCYQHHITFKFTECYFHTTLLFYYKCTDSDTFLLFCEHNGEKILFLLQ